MIRYFKDILSGNIRAFLANLSYSFIGFAIASLISISTYVISGRVLGPKEFASYGLVLALVQIFSFPVQGMDVAIIRSIVLAKKTYNVGEAALSGFLFLFGIIVASSGILYAVSSYASSFFQIPVFLFDISIGFMALLAVRVGLDSVIRATGGFRFQSLIKVGDAAISLGAFYILYELFNKHGYGNLIFSLSCGALFSIASYLIAILRTVPHLKINTAQGIQSWAYGKFGVLSAVGTILFLSIDKIVVEHRLGHVQLGIYSAYAVVSVSIAMQLSNIIMNVLFPEVAHRSDGRALMKQLSRIVIISIVPLFLFFTLVCIVLFSLFGKQYPLSIPLGMAMGMYATLTFLYTVYVNVFLSFGPKYFFFIAAQSVIGGSIFIGLLWYFLPSIGLFAAPFSFGIVFLYFAFLYFFWHKGYIGKHSSDILHS
ncbi:MAG: oligosaccharide flippase family protein [Candidatus Andersenbacteria bacterium]|nr:oligosaccharide flippase family protein [Candidatus Andersenbacteria bacterium]